MDRLEVGGQARQLEREVDPRNRPVLIAVDQRDFGGLVQGTGEPANEVQAGLLIKICLGVTDHGLAQQVGREGQRLVAQAQDSPGGLVGRGAGDEFRAITPAAERADQASSGSRSEPAGARATASFSHQGTCSPASARYSARCRRTESADRSEGRASMNRKSWTRTWGSFRLQFINRSSHQPRCQGDGPRPIRSKSSRPICRVLLSSAPASSAPGMVLVLKLAALEPDTVVMDAPTPECGGTTRILITAPSSIVRTLVHVEISGRSGRSVVSPIPSGFRRSPSVLMMTTAGLPVGAWLDKIVGSRLWSRSTIESE